MRLCSWRTPKIGPLDWSDQKSRYCQRGSAKNELTNIAGASYSYDANGNLTWGYNSHTNYVYDDENRLVQWFSYATSFGPPASGDLRTDFVYDGLSRLRSRSEYQYIGTGWYPNGTTYYVYDGMRVIQERTTAPTVSYTRGPDLSGTFEGAGGIGGLLARSTGYTGGWTNQWFYHADGNGNITYLVDANQALAASYRYDPFGNTTSSSGAQTGANIYRFSSKEIHINSGLYYYGYRFYDSNSQRWLSRDPVLESGGPNLYAFAANDPLGRYDPLGQQYGPGYPMPPGYPWPTSRAPIDCSGYKSFPNGQKCLTCSGYKNDTYPQDGFKVCEGVCEGFKDKYTGTFLQANAACVASCLIRAEGFCERIPTCAGRNCCRLAAHAACYATCGFLPVLGLPPGGWGVGLGNVAPSCATLGPGGIGVF
jgi:RHS repeat-associated protein